MSSVNNIGDEGVTKVCEAVKMRGAQLKTLDLMCKCCTWLVVSGVASWSVVDMTIWSNHSTNGAAAAAQGTILVMKRLRVCKTR